MTEQQKARIVELAKYAELAMVAKAGCLTLVGRIACHEYARDWSAEAFRIAQEALS